MVKKSLYYENPDYHVYLQSQDRILCFEFIHTHIKIPLKFIETLTLNQMISQWVKVESQRDQPR